MQNVYDTSYDLQLLFITDEAWFYLMSYINKQNEQAPAMKILMPLHIVKVCAK
jgi:hypothetical protein